MKCRQGLHIGWHFTCSRRYAVHAEDIGDNLDIGAQRQASRRIWRHRAVDIADQGAWREFEPFCAEGFAFERWPAELAIVEVGSVAVDAAGFILCLPIGNLRNCEG